MSDIVYSFQDASMVIQHASLGKYTMANGEGIGSINIVMANDVTTHDVAADGNVMVSKTKANNGTITITAQQTSALNKWLTKLYNYLVSASSQEWAKAIIIIRASEMGEITTANRVSFQKRADKPYQAQGQNVTWNLMAADIVQE